MIADVKMEQEGKTERSAVREPTASRPRETGTKRVIPWAAYLFVGVLALRLFALARLSESQFLLPTAGDMHFYNDWALRILRGAWHEPSAFYGLPLYAYLLAAIYKLCGYSPFIPGALQACCDAGTAVLLYKLGERIFAGKAEVGADRWRGKAIGLLAGIGWAFFQPAEAFSIILMPTAWLIFVFWFVVWEVVRRREAPGYLAWLGMGALVGFTAMGIATILFLLPLLLVACLLKWRREPTNFPRARLAAALLLFLGVGLGTSPAWIHNYVLARDPVLLSAHGGVNFWIGNNPFATGYPRFPPGLHAGQEAMLQDSITVAEKAAGRPLKRSEVSRYWASKARAYIAANPGSWFKLLGTKIDNFWNAFQYDDLSIVTTLREEGVILPGLRFGLVAALALPGCFLVWRRFPLSRWVAAAIVLHLFSLLSVFVTERYRMAAVPGLLLLGAAGGWELWAAGAAANYRRVGLYLGILALSTCYVSKPQREPSLWALDSYNSGLRALQSNNLGVAEERLDLAYAYVPENAELNFALGNLRLAQGRKQLAKGFYFATLQLDPRHEGSFNNLGILALEEKRWHLAANFFSKALEANPRDAKTLYLLAQAHFQAGELELARAQIDQAIRLNPKQPEFLALQEEIEQKLRSDAPRG